jgi:hypothetical protein
LFPPWQWLDGVSKSLVRYDFGFHELNPQNNLRVLRQLQYFQPFDIRHSDLVAQDMQRVEHTHSLYLLHLSHFAGATMVRAQACNTSVFEKSGFVNRKRAD